MKKTVRAFGIRACARVLEDEQAPIHEVWALRDSKSAALSRLCEQALRRGVRCAHVPRRELDELSGFGRHQGIVVEHGFPQGKIRDLDGLIALAAHKPVLAVMLARVQDPRNLGACLRSADGAGADALICPKAHAAGMTDTVAQVAKGAYGHVPVLTETNLARTAKRLRNAGFQVLGTADDAETDLWEQEYSLPLALVLGGEGKGMGRLLRDSCDAVFRLPMLGQVSCLNVSVACGIALYEIRRRTRS